MANFVAERNALKAMTRSGNNNNNNMLSALSSSYSFKSPIKKKYSIDEVAAMSTQFADLDYLLQAYLDDEDLAA